MKENQKILLLRLMKLVNIVLIAVTFAYAWLRVYAPMLPEPILGWERGLLILMFAALYMGFTRVYEAFLISQSRISELVGSQLLSAMLTDLCCYAVIALLLHRAPNVLPLLFAVCAQGLIATVWTYLVHQWFFRAFPPAPTAIIYEDAALGYAFMQEYGIQRRYHVCRALHVSDCDASLRCLAGIEVVFLADLQGTHRDPILKYCVEHGVEVYVIPRIGDLILSGATKDHVFHYPVLRVGRYYPCPEYVIAKRLLDIVFSCLALVVFSPLMLATAFAVHYYDRGPVFYRQTRLTQNGRTFTLLKFRSMRVDAESDGVARLSTGARDTRVTPVGRVIRKYRVDELPQLLNIIKGDLSIVGPRPERPEIAAQYEEQLPEFHLRLQAKAGLTGYAQVYGKYNTDPYHKLQMDLLYIAAPSVLEDMRICLATVKVLFRAESTEGVREGAQTALDTPAEHVQERKERIGV